MSTKNDVNSFSRGFSLVELSVVLIILGLLAGGITAGNSLVQGSKLRAVVAEFEQFNTAFNAFIVQYDYKPGDIPNASDYWAGATNGNANNEIDNVEGPVIWNHLSNANLISGNYNGTDEYPVSKLKKTAIYTFRHHTSLFNEEYGNLQALVLRGSNIGTYQPILVPKEASKIDKKIDDGIPNKGSLLGWAYVSGDKCILDPADANVLHTYSGTDELRYDLGETGIECVLSDIRYDSK